MKELVINQVVIPLLGVGINIVGGIAAYYAKQFYNKHKNVLELEEQQLQQKIGEDKYNMDVARVRQAVYAVEQLGKEFNWSGTFKHNKVLEMIEGKIALTDEQVFNIIKGVVGEINVNKNNVVTNNKVSLIK